MVKGLGDTTIRDFGGGWNVSDSDLNLNSRYQPVSDNVVRGVDGSFSPRQGTELFADFETGTYVDKSGSYVFSVVNASAAVTVTLPAHGRTSGDHVTISNFAGGAIGGIPAANINGTHGIIVIDANTFKFYVDTVATSTTAPNRAATIVFDDNILGGNIIHDQYFNRRLIVFTDIGEVGTIDSSFNYNRIWGVEEAEALTPGLVPTRRCQHWSSSTFKSAVIACNGYNKDKPIKIKDDFTTEFLVDAASGSNAFVPKADYVICLQGFVVFVRTEYGDPFLEFSAKGTDGTFSRDPAPADATEVDLSMITASVEPVLLGAAPIRDNLYVAFYDKGMVGILGNYTEAGVHQPDFSDTISENGTVSHRTMVPLGNDVLMCDYAGVPSVSVSQASGIYVPVRLSELIAPAIQSHLASLGEDTLRWKSYAVFNPSDRSYMLFLPIYDEIAYPLDVDPFLFNDDLREKNWAIIRTQGVRLFDNSYITISGAAAIGDLPANMINGKRKVVTIIDENTYVVELGGKPSSADETVGGGGSVVITPVNDETIGYIFEYNKEFKIRRWTRFREWNFDCACSSQRGRVFFGKGLKVYALGNNEVPLHADFINDYDDRHWQTSHNYAVGTRVRDDDNGKVYTCLIAHVSAGSGTFAEDRNANQNNWQEFVGYPINWAMETPWSDMRTRGRFKINKYIGIDSEGYDNFTVSAFTNKIRTKTTTGELIPQRSLSFQAGDTGGWGIQESGTYGGGRRTRDEKVWPFALRGKLVRWRYEGSTTKKVRITSHTMYYMLGNIR